MPASAELPFTRGAIPLIRAGTVVVVAVTVAAADAAAAAATTAVAAGVDDSSYAGVSVSSNNADVTGNGFIEFGIRFSESRLVSIEFKNVKISLFFLGSLAQFFK